MRFSAIAFVSYSEAIVFDDSHSWEHLDLLAAQELKNKNPISLVHTPTSINGQICFLFYTDGASNITAKGCTVFAHSEAQVKGQ